MKKAFVNLEKVKEIEAQYKTPYHIYDEAGIRENARKLKKAFEWNKGFREYFAVKATPNPVILKILREEGCGTDCSSMAELVLSDMAGISGDLIMFSSNNTPAEEFVKAKELGAIINLDDITHIELLDSVTGIPETICCRYNPGGVFKVSNSIMDNPGEAKYGFTKDQLIEGFLKLKELGAKQFGLHSFLVSNAMGNDYYPMLARTLFELAVEIQDVTGIRVSFVDLSGGIGIPYKPEDQPVDIMQIGNEVKKAYDEILLPAGLKDVAIYTELGRYMLAPFGHLITKVINEKNIYKKYIGVDACAANLMRPAMYGAYHHITVLGKESEPCDRIYDVVGSLCENNDKFAIDRRLPEIGIGDYLCIHDTGAHGFSMGYNYNGKLRSAELLLREDNTVELIRRAETLEDYFATLVVCE
jgi:diaminopimelate decarboxylase